MQSRLNNIYLEKLTHDATPSYYYIATVLQISFQSFCFKYKWSCWPSSVKEAEVSIKSIYKQHLDDDVETEELAAQYAYRNLNIVTVELRGKKRDKVSGRMSGVTAQKSWKQFTWTPKHSSNRKFTYVLRFSCT